MKIIITESQKKQLDYDYLSSCIKRRINLDGVEDIFNEAMYKYISVISTMEDFFEIIIDYVYDQLEMLYDIEKCRNDESWDKFSTPVKQFLHSRYKSIMIKYYEDYENNNY